MTRRGAFRDDVVPRPAPELWEDESGQVLVVVSGLLGVILPLAAAQPLARFGARILTATAVGRGVLRKGSRDPRVRRFYRRDLEPNVGAMAI